MIKIIISSFLILVIQAIILPYALTSQYPEEPDNSVKIGLLIPDNKLLAAEQGAGLAILEANKKGGFNGRPFQLIVRSMDGPWGTGSKEAVNMIFVEEVWAILGSHDGRNAHLVEQVTAKARIVFLSARTSDPTLSQAFVPWYFSCVPNDFQQAAALVEEIYNKRKINKIAAVSDNGYDSKLALESFLKKAKMAGKADPLPFFYDNSGYDFNNLLNQIDQEGINCIILFGNPSASIRIIQLLRQRKMKLSVFGTLSLLDEKELSYQELRDYEGVVLISPGYCLKSQGLSFQDEFQRIYGKLPGIFSAYAYDGMNLIVRAVWDAGLDRDKIQKSLAKIKYEGVTGLIQFDGKGNRLGVPGLMQIKNGYPVDIGRD